MCVCVSVLHASAPAIIIKLLLLCFCFVACSLLLSFLFRICTVLTHSSRSKVANLVKNTDKLADAQHELEARGEEDQALKLKAEEVKDKVKALREAVEKAKVLVAQTKYFVKDVQQKKQVALFALQPPSQRHCRGPLLSLSFSLLEFRFCGH